MKNIRIFAIAVASSVSLTSFSQQVEESVTRLISPLTPNAASLGKYGDIPVSLYTGIPNISIPIYDINVGGFTLPISLSYHAGGVQVDDVSSWVGTGWALNAGGILNRRMKGVEDYRMINSRTEYEDEIETILDPSESTSEKTGAASTLGTNRYDTESDIFSISTGTLSHKFFLDVSGDAHGMPARKLQIVPEGTVSFNQGNRIYYARWRIKDETGVEYVFGRTADDQHDEFEITKTETACDAQSGDPEYVNTWYLNEIKLPSGGSIKFTYDYFTSCRLNPVSYNYSLQTETSSITQVSTNYIRALRIKEIIFPTGKVEFVPSQEDRRDVAGDKVLREIRIFSTRSGQDYLEKSFRLVTNNPGGGSTPPNAFRLALLSVTEFDKDGNPLSPYTFEYKHASNENFTLGLPPRHSYAQDLWGYYNGKFSNQTLFPRFMYLDEWYGVISGEADRSVDPEKAQTGTLTKISYPTGGTTEFYYEPNVARGITAQDETLTWGNWASTPKPFQNPMWDLVSMHATETTSGQSNHVNVLNVNGNDFDYSEPFDIFSEGQALTDVAVSSHIMYGENNTPCTVTSPPGAAGSFWECLDIILEKKGTDGQFHAENSTVYFDRTYGLTKGTYRIKLAWKDPGLNQAGAYAYVDLSWTGPISPLTSTVDEFTEFEVGGLRIAKIVDTDADTGQETVRWFDYDYDESDYAISGSLHGSSGIIQNTLLHYTYGNIFSGFTNSSILQTGGGYVGYKKVSISYGADKKGGRQVSYFTTAKDYPDGNLAANKQWFESYDRVEVDWRRGLKERVIDLKFENDTYVPVRETENHFTLLSQETDPNTYHHLNVRIVPMGGAGGSGVSPATYKTVSEALYTDQTVEKTYVSSGQVAVLTTFEQNPENLAVSRSTTTDSDGRQTQVVTKYPVDYENVENINTLKASNIISVPIKTETTCDDKLVKGVVVKYTDSGQPHAVYRHETMSLAGPPAHSGTVIVPPNYALKSEFAYDPTDKKLVEVRMADGVPSVYIWGYGRSFPVVKIENMEATEIPTSLVTNIDGHTFTGGTLISEFQGDVDFLNTQVGTLRSNKAYRVTTYTYNTALGLTSQTDPNGLTSYFERDGYGRLQRTRDADGNIVQTIRYHFKGE